MPKFIKILKQIMMIFAIILSIVCFASEEWTQQEQKELLDLRNSGLAWNQIAQSLGRSTKACQSKHKRIIRQAEAQNQISLQHFSSIYIARSVDHFPLLKPYLKVDMLGVGYLQIKYTTFREIVAATLAIDENTIATLLLKVNVHEQSKPIVYILFHCSQQEFWKHLLESLTMDQICPVCHEQTIAFPMRCIDSEGNEFIHTDFPCGDCIELIKGKNNGWYHCPICRLPQNGNYVSSLFQRERNHIREHGCISEEMKFINIDCAEKLIMELEELVPKMLEAGIVEHVKFHKSLLRRFLETYIHRLSDYEVVVPCFLREKDEDIDFFAYLVATKIEE